MHIYLSLKLLLNLLLLNAYISLFIWLWNGYVSFYCYAYLFDLTEVNVITFVACWYLIVSTICNIKGNIYIVLMQFYLNRHQIQLLCDAPTVVPVLHRGIHIKKAMITHYPPLLNVIIVYVTLGSPTYFFLLPL